MKPQGVGSDVNFSLTGISFFLPMLPAQIHELFVFYRIPLAQKVNELQQMISLLPLESVRPWSEKKKKNEMFSKNYRIIEEANGQSSNLKYKQTYL